MYLYRVALADGPLKSSTMSQNSGLPTRSTGALCIANFSTRIITADRCVFRAVQLADVHVPRPYLPGMIFKGLSISIDIVRTGWAVAYEQKGAEYGVHGLDTFKQERRRNGVCIFVSDVGRPRPVYLPSLPQ